MRHHAFVAPHTLQEAGRCEVSALDKFADTRATFSQEASGAFSAWAQALAGRGFTCLQASKTCEIRAAGLLHPPHFPGCVLKPRFDTAVLHPATRRQHGRGGCGHPGLQLLGPGPQRQGNSAGLNLSRDRETTVQPGQLEFSPFTPAPGVLRGADARCQPDRRQGRRQPVCARRRPGEGAGALRCEMAPCCPSPTRAPGHPPITLPDNASAGGVHG